MEANQPNKKAPLQWDHQNQVMEPRESAYVAYFKVWASVGQSSSAFFREIKRFRWMRGKELRAVIVERRELTREQVEQIVREAREKEEIPDLSGMDLSRVPLRSADLRGVNLKEARFREADLRWANLKEADLQGSNLTKAVLIETNLTEANLIGATLVDTKLRRANLSKANFREADLKWADLAEADSTEADFTESDLKRANLIGANLVNTTLSRANLSEANLREADLSNANLTGANLTKVDLSEANFSGANLSKTNLSGTNFTQTKLNNTNFSSAILNNTSFIRVDLSQAEGLTTVSHQGASNIDINTIHKSKDKIPEVFLAQAGVDAAIIRWQHSLHTRPTVFISYSHKDEKEKDRLLEHLRVLERQELITVWHDERIGAGANWKEEIKKAIAQASVAILLISRNFLASDFIQDEEIPQFLKRRESDEKLVIFPIITRPCAWNQVDWLVEMQVRPKGGEPVWGKNRDVDTELTNITNEVIEVIQNLWLPKG